MKKQTAKIFSSLIIGLSMQGHAQDIHWSQPNNALLYQNPAFTCIDDRYSIGLNYRDQWSTVNKSYKTYMAAGDNRFEKNMPDNIAFGLGGILCKDVSADGSYQTQNIGFTLSGILKANPFVKIGAGIGYNLFQSILADNFTWGSQFDGQNYNSTLASGENNIKSFHQYGDLNAGVSYIYNRNVTTVSGNDNMKWIIGYSINHLTRPDIAINGNTDKLPIKHQGTITGLLPIKDNFSLKPLLMICFQGKRNEIVFGTLARYAIGQISQITGIKKGMLFSFGAVYRVNDAFIPTVEFQKANYIISMSYDVNASKFSKATKFRGGFEISLRIIAPGTYLYIDHSNRKNSKSKKDSKPSF